MPNGLDGPRLDEKSVGRLEFLGVSLSPGNKAREVLKDSGKFGELLFCNFSDRRKIRKCCNGSEPKSPGQGSIPGLGQDRVQNRSWVVQETHGKALRSGSKHPLTRPPNQFRESPIFNPSPKRFGLLCNGPTRSSLGKNRNSKVVL